MGTTQKNLENRTSPPFTSASASPAGAATISCASPHLSARWHRPFISPAATEGLPSLPNRSLSFAKSIDCGENGVASFIQGTPRGRELLSLSHSRPLAPRSRRTQPASLPPRVPAALGGLAGEAQVLMATIHLPANPPPAKPAWRANAGGRSCRKRSISAATPAFQAGTHKPDAQAMDGAPFRSRFRLLTLTHEIRRTLAAPQRLGLQSHLPPTAGPNPRTNKKELRRCSTSISRNR